MKTDCKAPNPNEQLPLDQLAVGKSGVLGSTVGHSATVLRLQEMGFTEGTRIRLVRRGPMGGPLQFFLRDSFLCVRAAEAKFFMIYAD